MSVKIQNRRDPAASWAANNPVLAEGELGIAVAVGVAAVIKAGDGSTAWNSLPAISGGGGGGGVTSTDLTNAINAATAVIAYEVDKTGSTWPDRPAGASTYHHVNWRGAAPGPGVGATGATGGDTWDDLS